MVCEAAKMKVGVLRSYPFVVKETAKMEVAVERARQMSGTAVLRERQSGGRSSSTSGVRASSKHWCVI